LEIGIKHLSSVLSLKQILKLFICELLLAILPHAYKRGFACINSYREHFCQACFVIAVVAVRGEGITDALVNWLAAEDTSLIILSPLLPLSKH
jgi:hypothetical protein